MKISKDISNRDLLATINDRINWINLWEQRFSTTTYEQFLKTGYISPKQRAVLFKIAGRALSKSESMKSFGEYKSDYFKRITNKTEPVAYLKAKKVEVKPQHQLALGDANLDGLSLKELIDRTIKSAHEAKKPNKTLSYLYRLATELDEGKLDHFKGTQRESLITILNECLKQSS
jgi:hypothetical protein